MKSCKSIRGLCLHNSELVYCHFVLKRGDIVISMIFFNNFILKMCKLDVSECFCELCNLHEKDEKHFLIRCPMYLDYRTELFLQVEHKYPSFSEKNEEPNFIL